jgi:hypothetical protein
LLSWANRFWEKAQGEIHKLSKQTIQRAVALDEDGLREKPTTTHGSDELRARVTDKNDQESKSCERTLLTLA